MKTISIKLLLVLLIFNLTSCKKENSTPSFTDYQFSDQPQTVNCPNADNKLLNEAVYAFENDIVNYYDAKNKTVIRGYNGFLRQAISSKKVAIEEFVSEHSVNIAKALKDSGIFNNKGLDYNLDIIKCIAENMNTGDLKTTFNALLTTNSMSKTLYGPALGGKASDISKDKYLGLYVALEYYYAEINKTDFSKVDFKNRETKTVEPVNRIRTTPTSTNNGKVDFNKRPR